MKTKKLSPSVLASVVTDVSKPYYLLSTDYTLKFKYDDNGRTDKITGYKYWFIQDNSEPFQVALPAELNKNLKIFKFQNLEAYDFNGTIYFRAESIQLFE
ncbi:hypothetical protein ACTGVC_07635 [Streptococcus suis]